MVRLYFVPTRLSTFAPSAAGESRISRAFRSATRDKHPIAGDKWHHCGHGTERVRMLAIATPQAVASGGTRAVLWPLAVYFGIVLLLAACCWRCLRCLGERHHERATGLPYESGVASTGSARLRFGVSFYLVAVFFVIFDLEAAFLFAWAVALREIGWAGYVEGADLHRRPARRARLSVAQRRPRLLPPASARSMTGTHSCDGR